MNEENTQVENQEEQSFVDELYTSLQGEERGWDKDLFAERISGDQEYNDKIYGLLGEQDFTQEDFHYATGIKKKEEPEDSSGQNLESLSDLNAEQLASFFPEGTPEYMLDIYATSYDFEEDDFDEQVVTQYKTSLDKMLREQNPSIYDSYQGIPVSDLQGAQKTAYETALGSYEGEATKDILTSGSKKRELQLMEEERFKESIVAAEDIKNETGYNVRSAGMDLSRRAQEEHRAFVESTISGEDYKNFVKADLDAAQPYMNFDAQGKPLAEDDPNRMVLIPVDVAKKFSASGSFKYAGKGDSHRAVRYNGEYSAVTSQAMNNNGIQTSVDGITMKASEWKKIVQNSALKNVNEKFQGESLAAMKQEVLDSLEEGLADDNEVLETLDDYFFNQFGLNLNLDGDGRYNEAWLISDMARGLYQGGVDLLSNPAEYLAASVSDVVTGNNTAEKVRRMNALDAEEVRGNMTVVPKGIGESFGDGDIYNGFRQSAVGLAETLPTVGLVVASSALGVPMVGTAMLGVSSGVNAWSDSKNEDDTLIALGKSPIYENEMQRLGASVLTGGTEAGFALVGSAIFSRAALSASSAYSGASTLAKAQGRAMTKEMAKGFLKHYGLSAGTEGLEELATTAVQMVGSAYISGRSIDTDELVNGMVDSFIVGALAGGVFEYSGSKFGQARAAMNARGDMSNLQAEAEGRSIIRGLEAQIQQAEPGSKERKGLEAQLTGVQSNLAKRNASRQPFYDMLAVRHPSELNNVSELDIKIEHAYRQFESSTNAEQQAIHKATFDQLVIERSEITGKFSQESTELTQEEQDVATNMLRSSVETSLVSEAQMAQNAVDILEEKIANGESVSPVSLREARAAASDAQAKSENAQTAKNRLKEAEQLLAESVTDESLAEVERAASSLNDALGMAQTRSGDVRAAADMIRERVMDSKARGTDSWVTDAVSNMDNSSLSQTEIDQIFESDNFAMLTAENPYGKAELSDKENAERNEKAKKYLEEQGLTFHEIKGRYENGENSFLVEGMTVEQSAEFAKLFEQESVAHKNGLVKGDGKINLFEGGVEKNDTATDFFSAIKDTEGNVVKFGMTPSTTYQDSKGKTITEDEYTEGNNVVVSGKDSKGVEGRFTDFSSDPDAGMEIPDDALSGLNQKQRTFLRNAMESLRKIHPGLTLRMHDKASMDAFQSDAGGYWDGQMMHISVDNILSNMDSEVEFLGKVKTFEETVLEEVIHSAISPMLETMGPAGRSRLLNDLEAIVKKDVSLRQRAATKERSEKQRLLADGYTEVQAEAIAADERITELISAIASNSDALNIGTVQKWRLWLNKLMKTTNKGFVISSDSSALSIANAFSNAVADGSHVSVQSRAIKGDAGRASAKMMRPQDLPMDEKFEVSYWRSSSYTGISKLQTATFNGKWHFINTWNQRTFGGSMADKMSGVEFVSGPNKGTRIDADQMANWNLKKPMTRGDKIAADQKKRTDLIVAGNTLLDKVQQLRKKEEGADYVPYMTSSEDKILKALDIEVDENNPRQFRSLTEEQLRDAESILFGDAQAKERGRASNKLNSKGETISEEFKRKRAEGVKRSSRSAIEIFIDEERENIRSEEGRASNKLTDELRTGGRTLSGNVQGDLAGMSFNEFVQRKIEDFSKLTGMTEKEINKSLTNAKSTTYQLITQESLANINQAYADANGKDIRFQDLSSADKLKMFQEDPAVRESIVRAMEDDFAYSLKMMENEGFENPENFFKEYDAAKGEFLTELSKEFPGVPVEQFSPVLDVLVGSTSTGMSAYPNMLMAMNIFHNALGSYKRNYIPGKPFDFIQKDLINEFKDSAGGRYKNLDIGASGYTIRTIGRTLEIANELFDKHLSESGQFDSEGFKEAMSERHPSKRELPVMADEISSRPVGSPKIGSFIVTMFGDIGADYLTQDVHVMDYLGVFTGESGLPRGATISMNRASVIELLNQVTPKERKGVKSKTLMNELFEMTEDASLTKKQRRAAKDMVVEIMSPMEGRSMDPDSKRLRYYVVKEFVDQHNLNNPDNQYSIAQVGQMLYAFDQVMAYRLDGEKMKRNPYTPWHPLMREIMQDGSYQNLNRAGAKAEFEASMSNLRGKMDIGPERVEATGGKISRQQEMEMEGRASSKLRQLEFDFFNDNDLKVNALDSKLYRDRAPEEALQIKGGGLITNEVTNKALSTDAASRRVMGKGKSPAAGDKVGIRLNLNVLKNTGVPVQTIHEKTATGEALQYAPVVRVSNVNLNVNQNARNKIVTFQENKFPMASVDGELVSTNMDEISYEGVKAVFNPFKHNTFVDVAGRPIKSAEGAVVVGNNVYLTGKIEYLDYSDPVVEAGRGETEAQRAKRVKRGPKYDAAVRRFRAYSEAALGVKYSSVEQAEAAYNDMDVTSKVALDKSEVAANAEEAIKQGRASARIRQTAGRTATLYDNVRNEILGNPENYISQQNIKASRDKLSSMATGDLMEIMTDEAIGRLSQRNDDMGVLAGIELINRAVAEGNAEAIPSIISELSKIGTTAGRLLRHFAELKSSTPAGMVMMIEKAVENGGNTLSDTQKQKLVDLSAKMMEANAKVRKLMEQGIRGEDVDADLEAEVKRLKEVEKNLETFTNAVIERGWGSIGSMLIQGNLLTPMSQITNVVANLYNAALMLPRDIIALPIERLVNVFGYDSPMKRNYSVNAYMYGLRKFGAGFVESLEAVVTGQEKDVTEWRIHRGFAPFRSLMSAFGKGEELPLGPDGKASMSQRSKLFIQGTLGIPAETMFRFLGVGDTPFRRGVEGIEVYQEALARGLKGEELSRFLKHPPMNVRERAESEGRKLTFQEQGVASELGEGFVNFVQKSAGRIFNFLPGVNGQEFAKFLVRSQMPYVRTPANILYETLTFTSPVIAIPRMMSDLKRGDSRSAAQNMGKLIMGQSVAYAAEIFIREGIISGALEIGDDEERNMAYDQFPPNSVNISALKRFMSGGTASKQADDYFMSYQKLGIFGAIIGARVKATNASDPGLGEDPFIANRMVRDAFGVTAFSTMAHMMDQSFLQGVSSFTELLSAGDADDFERKFERWASSTFSAVSSTVLPNTLSALYKQDREYLPDTRVSKDKPLEERIMQRFRYTLLDRTFNLGDAPIRVNWKGEPIRQKPTGAIPGGYYLFDVFKARQGEADEVSNEVWRLYEQTEELTKACGTPYFATTRKVAPPKIKTKKEKAALAAIGRDYTFLNDADFMSGKVRFSIEDINELARIANSARYEALLDLTRSEGYAGMDDSDKLEAMNKIGDSFNGLKEFGEDRMFKEHTIKALDIMQKIYDNERQEEN